MALNAHPKIGSQTLKKILTVFEDPKKLWAQSSTRINRMLGDKISELIIEAREKYSPEEELEKLRQNDIGYITMYDKAYPKLLLETVDCPAILYIRGNIDTLSLPSIAVVGSRKFTNYGKRVAKRLVSDCVNAGLCIVSGLALGIDGEAHQAALESGGLTVGVLGCGLDRVYPASHIFLAREIIDRGGAIISEYPPGTSAFRQNFPARNRIIAGMTLGTLVIEASEDSGSLITASCALDYNREVFSIPGPIDSDTSFGANKLIQDGAKLVTQASDIFEELNLEAKKCEQKAKEILPENKEEELIIEILMQGEKPVDLIIQESGLNVISVNTALTMLEMKGIIGNIGGGIYRKIC